MADEERCEIIRHGQLTKPSLEENHHSGKCASLPMLNIRRVDHAASHTHCWRVTVQRRKRIFVRDFSDGRHASQQHALRLLNCIGTSSSRPIPP